MNEFDKKVNEIFAGRVVRKDLSKKIKEGINVPIYVLEYLLGMYCSTDDEDSIKEGVKKVKQILAENYVRPDEAEKIKFKITEKGSYTVIDRLDVNVDVEKGICFASFMNLGLTKVPISSEYVKRYEKLLAGGIWCIVKLGYFDPEEDAELEAAAKEVKKKDMASIAMSYGYVYVAQISMGADMAQTIKAISEAEAYPGPSLIIAYAPCINHGIKKGMSKAQTEEALAVECGYWNNFRFNPAAEGNKFTLDSKEPKLEGYQEFLNGEVRYNALMRANPERATELFARNEAEAKARYEYLKKLVVLHSAE